MTVPAVESVILERIQLAVQKLIPDSILTEIRSHAAPALFESAYGTMACELHAVLYGNRLTSYTIQWPASAWQHIKLRIFTHFSRAIPGRTYFVAEPGKAAPKRSWFTRWRDGQRDFVERLLGNVRWSIHLVELDVVYTALPKTLGIGSPTVRVMLDTQVQATHRQYTDAEIVAWLDAYADEETHTEIAAAISDMGYRLECEPQWIDAVLAARKEVNDG